MKKWWICILFAGLLVYLIIVLTFVAAERENILCNGLQVVIRDKNVNSFIEEADVERLIVDGYGELTGQPVSQIDKEKLEQVLINNSVVKSAQVYNSLDGYYRVDINQRRPILRVMSNEGYYLDEDGETMPLSNKYTARVLIATGKISREYAGEVLYPFVQFIRNDIFFEPLIEQIVVHRRDDVVLIPKVGNFIICLGSLEHMEEKMEKLRLFYRDGVTKRGWNVYKEINLKFDKQIVCVKR